MPRAQYGGPSGTRRQPPAHHQRQHHPQHGPRPRHRRQNAAYPPPPATQRPHASGAGPAPRSRRFRPRHDLGLLPLTPLRRGRPRRAASPPSAASTAPRSTRTSSPAPVSPRPWPWPSASPPLACPGVISGSWPSSPARSRHWPSGAVSSPRARPIWSSSRAPRAIWPPAWSWWSWDQYKKNSTDPSKEETPQCPPTTAVPISFAVPRA